MIVLLPSILLTLAVGSELGVVEAKYQPAKIAAAEAQWETCQPCSFPAFQVGGGNVEDHTPTQIIQIPHLLSLLATNSWNGKVIGLHQIQKEDEKKYGPGDYLPNIFIEYWSMGIMAYVATLVLLLTLWAGWLLKTGKLADSETPLETRDAGRRGAVHHEHGRVELPTESGRQPWIVQGLSIKMTQLNVPNSPMSSSALSATSQVNTVCSS